jgi:subtilase family serine protease
MQKSLASHRLGYWLATNLTLLGLVVVTLFSLVGRANASSIQGIFQPYIKIDSKSPISDQGGTSSDQGGTHQSYPCQSPTSQTICYGPKQIREAYNIQPLLDNGTRGQGSTIVILDAYQAPNIQADLNRFDQAFGLDDANLDIIAPDGLTPFNSQDSNQVDWSAEISLDVEWAHVVAPAAKIDLVLAKSDMDLDILSALNYSIDNNLGDVISMSFGGNEACTDGLQLWHEAFKEATSQGITLLASTGDSGAAETSCDGSTFVKEVSYPATDSFITAVGGTELQADPSTGAYQNEVVWNEPDGSTGGGFSTSVPKPFYQNSVNSIGNYRGIPDVSYDSAVAAGGVLVNWSEGSGGAGFYIFGGTSAGSPQWAGIVALAAQYGKSRLGLLNPTLYSISQQPQYAADFHDVTSGDNTVTLVDANNKPVTIQGYDAGQGWNPTTGWGSPQVANLVPYLANNNGLNLPSQELASL